MIYIRADGGREIGLGHIMRCISVASEIMKAGEEVCFIVADESAKDLLEAGRFRYRVLGTDYRQMEAEREKLRTILEEVAPKLILVDSYQVTPSYMKWLGTYAPVAYLDDMGKIAFPLDVLINYNIFAESGLYQNGDEQIAECLLGMRYAPLRKEFIGVEYQVRRSVQGILITTGGSDKFNLAGKFLDSILSYGDFSGIDCYVVSGMFNPYLSYLEDKAKGKEKVHICKNVTNMGELMKRCDVAITAGGSTMYELAAVGVPMICFSFVDNQEQIVRGFAKKKLVAYAGDYLRQGEAMVQQGVDALLELTGSYEARVAYSRYLREAVDGGGASRIAGTLVGKMKK